MFGFFKRRFGGDRTFPSLDSVRFDTSGYEAHGDPDPGRLRAWTTPFVDGVGLYFFGKPPDLPAAARSVAELHDFYAQALKNAGVRLVEAGLTTADGRPVVRVIFKTPQSPTGMTYVGSLTLPFRDFSFVVKVQCEETGVTGLRETTLLARRVAAGENPVLVGGHLHIPNWNPDADCYDVEFPDHPASRVRQVLRAVAVSLVIEPRVAKLPRFCLPPTVT
jgi:hypothetical protein